MRADLPFLIEYGVEVSLVLLVTLVIGSIGLLQVFRRVLRGARTRAEIHRRATQAATGDALTIVGKLVAGEASTFVQGERVVTYRSDELVVEHQGERVAILGDVVVEHGATESTSWFRPPSTPHHALVENTEAGVPMMLRTVQQGDDIIVTGMHSSTAAGSEERSYRALGGMSAIVSGETPVVISAATPAARPPALGFAWIGVVIVFTTAWFLAFRWVGETAHGRMGGENWLAESPAAFSAATIAAAIPTSRQDALTDLEWTLASPKTDASLRFALGFAEFKGECPVELLRRHGFFEEGLALARKCGSLRDIATELAFMGRFEEAASVLVAYERWHWYDISVTVAIATGRWKDAAIAIETNPSVEAACLGALFRTFAGERGAFERVRLPPGASELTATCLLLKTLTLPEGEQRSAIERLVDKRDDIQPRSALQALWALAGSGPPTSKLDESGLTRGVRPSSWFAPFALAAYTGGDAKDFARIHADLAHLAIVRGDFAAAQREHQEASNGLDDADVLERDIQLQSGSTEVPPHGYATLRGWRFADAIQLRLGRDAELRESGYGAHCYDSLGDLNTQDAAGDRFKFNDALIAASKGDGAPLFGFLKHCDAGVRVNKDLLFGVLPRLRTYQREIGDQLRLQYEPLRKGTAAIPFAFLNDLTTYRELARFTGNHEQWQVAQQMIDRHVQVLGDRQKLIALLFWADTVW